MNKKERQNKQFYKYKKRLKYWAAIWKEDLQELLQERKYNHLKTQATMCSCYMCSKYYKYNRAKEKQAWKNLEKEYMKS